MTPNAQEPPAPLLSLKGITKRFGRVTANSGIDLDVYPGQVHAILGENGAGKSTLMSVLSGRYRPDEGEILLRGRPVSFSSPARALEMGIGMVYQRFMLVEPLSVAENIILGTTGMKLRLDLAGACREISRCSEHYGIMVDPRKKIWQLSMGERQRVEILKLLYRKAEILIFDEPTAILSPPEIEVFFQTLDRLVARSHTILFISHKLDEVMRLAHRISIMRHGKMIGTTAPGKIRSKRELARLMVGREILLKVDKEEVPRGDPVLSVQGLGAERDPAHSSFEGIEFQVRKGEVLAVTGVAGNGQDMLVACLTGRAPFSDGTITFLGREFTPLTWGAARKDRMAYVPEDRYTTGTVPGQSLTENFMLTRLDEFGRGPFLQSGKAREATLDAIRRYDVKAASPEAAARHLSGGNLQKFILARELGRNPDLIIAEHPTQGLDVGATEDIWQALLAQRAHAGVLLVSGDLKEVLSLADRIAVMFRGRILRVISAHDEDAVSHIGLLMAGVTESGRSDRVQA